MHHPVFKEFRQMPVIGTGRHVFDFLGGRTNVAFKRGWEKHALPEGSKYTGNWPAVNEHYFDWIALLESVRAADDTFNFVELGAGWGTWSVHAIKACAQITSITHCKVVAVEAEPTHYRWMLQHFRENGIDGSDHKLIHGAVTSERGILRFPYLENPDEDYGASLRSAGSASRTFPVEGLTLQDILDECAGMIDLLHVDIQGAEYDVLPGNLDLLDARVKAIMVGTHISLDHHRDMQARLEGSGWQKCYAFDRNGSYDTEFGPVQFGDGFLYYRNPALNR